MKTIETLVEDIHRIFQLPHEFSEERLERFGKVLAKSVARKINQTGGGGTLRMSSIGTKCNRKLWYSVNLPEIQEILPVEAQIKFLYGDILEVLLLFLAEEAGHSVVGCQDEVVLNGVVGHRDAVIDGVVVDVKSASSMSFQKFKKGLTYAEDDFGYVDQLQGYLHASQEDPLVTDKSRAAFLVIDKTLGHICLDIHKKSDQNYTKIIELKKQAVTGNKPHRHYTDEPDGKSGNRKLSTACSYCSFKKHCWGDLRTFLYSGGPRYLTEVVRVPDVPEL